MVEYSDAVFILANKLASDPLAEDSTNIMTVLALGQYIEERSLVLRAQLAHPLRRLLAHITFTPVSITFISVFPFMRSEGIFSFWLIAM
jgi:hypothetical protein